MSIVLLKNISRRPVFHLFNFAIKEFDLGPQEGNSLRQYFSVIHFHQIDPPSAIDFPERRTSPIPNHCDVAIEFYWSVLKHFP